MAAKADPGRRGCLPQKWNINSFSIVHSLWSHAIPRVIDLMRQIYRIVSNMYRIFLHVHCGVGNTKHTCKSSQSLQALKIRQTRCQAPLFAGPWLGCAAMDQSRDQSMNHGNTSCRNTYDLPQLPQLIMKVCISGNDNHSHRSSSRLNISRHTKASLHHVNPHVAKFSRKENRADNEINEPSCWRLRLAVAALSVTNFKASRFAIRTSQHFK